MEDVLELQRQIAAYIKSGDITKAFDLNAIEACLIAPQEIDIDIRWQELFDLHVLANIFQYREVEYKTVATHRLKVHTQDIPHKYIDYVYSRTERGSILRDAIAEEMVVKKEPLLEQISYPKEFLFDLAEEYRNQEDECTDEWESDDSVDDEGISAIRLRERLSRLHKILRGNNEDQEEEGSQGEEESEIDDDESNDIEMFDGDEDRDLEDFEKEFLSEISKIIFHLIISACQRRLNWIGP
ncbi:hypothetical protein DL95DRAFT_417961 [Leptodontidium sp. 2 PMI_412]|nr:hypothetical protein DL95DRAFT_417961 [Leptodontidium sp. 2 PMI_412]